MPPTRGPPLEDLRNQVTENRVAIGGLNARTVGMERDLERIEGDVRDLSSKLAETNRQLGEVIVLLNKWGGVRDGLMGAVSAAVIAGGALWAVATWVYSQATHTGH